MKVKFYTFSKRNKSTKIPAGTDSYNELEVTLKDATSIQTPIFLLQTVNPASYNYIYVPTWDRYYFITDVKYVEGMWEVGGTVDFLGSFKSEIGTTSASILYATGASDNIVDPRIPVKADIIQDISTSAFEDFTIFSQGGPIVIGITGKGSFGPYLMLSPTQIREMVDGVDGVINNWTDIIDWGKQQAYGSSAAECLKSAISLPFTINASDVSSGNAENLVLGNYPCKDGNGNDIKGYHITKPVIVKHGTISIPWASNDWKRISAYTNIELYVPLIGMLNIPATEVMNDSSLTIDLAINVTSGDLSVLVKGTQTGIIVASGSGNCAIPTAYGSTGINTGKQTQAFATGIGSIITLAATTATSGGASLALKLASGAAMAGATGTLINALGGTGQGSGGLGGGATSGLEKNIICFLTQKVLTDSQSNINPILGKPVMAVHTIATYTGFVQTDGFQLESSRAFSSEKDSINQLLDSGIYYE